MPSTSTASVPAVFFVGLADVFGDTEERAFRTEELAGVDTFVAAAEDVQRPIVVFGEDLADRDALVQAVHEADGVAIVVADGDAHHAMEVVARIGADVFATRPLNRGQLQRIIHQELRAPRPRRAVSATPIPRMVGDSAWIRQVSEKIGYMAPSSAPVLIGGESGTGKEIVARAIHVLSPRRHGPLVVVNCGAFPPELIESQLFGHEKGAFTGASERHAGCFEAADGGTLFLDEVGELLPKVQVKLLRALQDGRFTRVGGTERIDVDTRIIAATNRNLRQELAEGTFREDLFYRLNVLNLKLPPLRERPTDVRALWEHFVREAAEAEGTCAIITGDEVHRLLEQYDWPGNVRELKNVARRVVAMRPTREITPTALPSQLRNRQMNEDLRIPGMTLDEIERHAILKTYRSTGSARAAAEILGISERKVFYRLKQYREEDSEATEDTRPILALVEDDFDLRMALTDLLSRSYRVEAHDCAETLLETLDEREPAVIVTDLRLPDADGLELLQGVQAERDIPVILISAFANAEARDRAREHGAVAFLDKPVDTILLGRVLERATTGRPIVDE